MAVEGGKSEEQLQNELALLEEQQREVDQRLREQRTILGRGQGPPLIRPPGRGVGRGAVYARGRGLLPPGGLGRPLRDPPFARHQIQREFPGETGVRKRLSSAVVVDGAADIGGHALNPLKRRQLTSVIARSEGEEALEGGEIRPEPGFRGDANAPALGEGQPPLQRPGPRQNFLARGTFAPNRYDPPEDEAAAVTPRVVPEMAAPEIKRSRRLFGALLGTLAQFRKEDEREKNSDAHAKRVTSLQRADERTRELREKARKLEREATLAKREKDLVLRNRLAAKTDEKQLELLFLKWTAHEQQLTGFLRTKTEPHLFYVPAKHNETTEQLFDVRQAEFAEWHASRRAELTGYEQQLQADALRVPESGRWGAGTQNVHQPANVPGSRHPMHVMSAAVVSSKVDVNGPVGDESEGEHGHGGGDGVEGVTGDDEGDDVEGVNGPVEDDVAGVNGDEGGDDVEGVNGDVEGVNGQAVNVVEGVNEDPVGEDMEGVNGGERGVDEKMDEQRMESRSERIDDTNENNDEGNDPNDPDDPLVEDVV